MNIVERMADPSTWTPEQKMLHELREQTKLLKELVQSLKHPPMVATAQMLDTQGIGVGTGVNQIVGSTGKRGKR